MNREEFLKSLKNTIWRLHASEVEDIIRDYEEHFDSGIAEGKSEEDIARALGNPRVIGRAYRMDVLLKEGERKGTFGSITRAVLATLGLGLFNAIFVIGPYFGLVGALAGLWGAGIGLTASGLGAVIAVIFRPLLPAFIGFGGVSPVFFVLAGIGVCALGLLSIIGLVKLSKWFFLLTVRYLKFNLRVIRKEV